MEYTGNIRKMESVPGDPIRYVLPVGHDKVGMNSLINQPVSLEYLGKINCIRCGRETRKSFAQGYCYPCFTTAPETEECVLKPELCRAHLGEARDMEFAKEHCLIEHVVYLSFTSGVKVGVTRNTQVPTRWIDQGAIMAVELARTPDRYTAGMIEVAMKSHIQDKTNWRKMLSGPDPGGADLVGEKSRLMERVPQDLVRYLSPNDDISRLSYPVEEYPEKVTSLNFDKNPLVSGVLSGIKGQYLLFQGGSVINVRKFGGYLVRVVS
jgi:hypothetical protein